MSDFKSFDEFRRQQHKKEERVREEPDMSIIPDHEPPKVPEEMEKKKKPGKERRHRAYRVYKKYSIIFCSAVLVILLSLFLFPLPFGAIQISGGNAVSEADVLFEGNVRQPVNVLQVSTSDLQKRLSQDVRIASVSVTREFPFYIRVVITERTAVAVMRSEFGYIWMDEAGVVTSTDSSIKNAALPFVTGKRMGNALLGETISDAEVRKALVFIGNLSEEGRTLFSEVNVGNADNIIAYTKDGMSVRLGNGEYMDQQAVLAEHMVSDVKTRGLTVEYIDANISSPYIRLKK